MFWRKEPWKFCLSLAAAAWTHSFLLAAAGAWNLLLFLKVFPWKRSFTEAAVEAYWSRSGFVAAALRGGFLALAVSFLLASVLTDLAICTKSARAAYLLAWLNLGSSFLSLLLLLHLWTAFGVLLLSSNATLGELVLWGNPDLLYSVLSAIPMTRIYASLGAVFSAGGSGFEGKSAQQLQQQQQQQPSSSSSGTLKMGALGTWKVGLSLQQAAAIWGLFCLAVAVLDFSVFWIKISEDPLVKMNKVGLVFVAEGLTCLFAAVGALAGSAAGAPFFTLSALLFTLLLLPLALALLLLLGKPLFWGAAPLRQQLAFNFASLHALGAQLAFISTSFFAVSALYSLFVTQTRKEIQSAANEALQPVDLEEESKKLLSEP
ncbi:hypothetical protein, conserved [Eimeria tenella]|uniref:Transmembrane protein n=1 Tax=Eimeria tenella TaxID=5802 RepID=U6KSM7_EIMTE|nr:hypothetical protein, conserved [Eimeria tenella]CDJ41132.1 hypothetical protein, conserved [Eimeria tenella]|eukprot:XP_013231882.1 hypothetical protein, conserved [Eimeria tenella]